MRQLSLALCLTLCAAGVAGANFQGLNQVLTPDLQPVGNLSLAFQEQHQAIGSPSGTLLELGVNRYLDLAVTQAFTPSQWSLGVETGFRRGQHLFAAGLANWTWGPGGSASPQPFVEYGYYGKWHEGVLGALWADGTPETILGYAYNVSPRLQLIADWQSGAENFSTVGDQCNFTPNLYLSTSLWHENAAPHRTFPFSFLCWTVKVF